LRLRRSASRGSDDHYHDRRISLGRAVSAHPVAAGVRASRGDHRERPVGLPHPDADPAREGELKRLYVDTSHHGRGIGKQLLALGLGYLSERYGDAPQWIGVWSENIKAQALYRANGFEKAGEYGFVVGGVTDREFILRKR
jgi:ribosomal protein S18 acetylase RimI-like enzyme